MEPIAITLPNQPSLPAGAKRSSKRKSQRPDPKNHWIVVDASLTGKNEASPLRPPIVSVGSSLSPSSVQQVVASILSPVSPPPQSAALAKIRRVIDDVESLCRELRTVAKDYEQLADKNGAGSRQAEVYENRMQSLVQLIPTCCVAEGAKYDVIPFSTFAFELIIPCKTERKSLPS